MSLGGTLLFAIFGTVYHAVNTYYVEPHELDTDTLYNQL